MDIQEYGNGNGKGDTPRNCMSPEFKSNYDAIDWEKKKDEYQCEERSYLDIFVEHIEAGREEHERKSAEMWARFTKVTGRTKEQCGQTY